MWTTPADLKAQVQKWWDRGLLLASLVDGRVDFPRRLTLKGPASSEMAGRFEQVRLWIAELRQGAHYRIVMREVRHRILGSNRIPSQVWVDTIEDALAIIGKTKDAKRFNSIVALTRDRQNDLLPWLAEHPLKALQFVDQWPVILDLVVWMQNHHRPGIYLRQVDVPGVDSKFIEANRGVLTELFDLVLPPSAIDTRATGVKQFCRRYGFRDKPQLVRFRILDRRLAWFRDDADQDFTVTGDQFARLNMNVSWVFIVENEISFLDFPPIADSIVIFGSGYGFDALTAADWLMRCPVYYWGDIDTNGFAILDQCRSHLPHAKSFLMDRDTLMAHKPQWGVEPHPVIKNLSRLSGEEREVYADLCANRMGTAVRLEQERISFGLVEAVLKSLVVCGTERDYIEAIRSA